MRINNQWQYEVQLYHQIKFCQHSVKKLKKAKKSCIEMAYYIQNLLVSLGNIAKILHNPKNIKSRERSQMLQMIFDIDISKIPNIMNRKLRNTSEHIDERIDSAEKNCLFGDMVWGAIDNRHIEGFLRGYSPEEQKLTFVNAEKEIQIMELTDIVMELKYLQHCKGMKYIWQRYKDTDKFYL